MNEMSEFSRDTELLTASEVVEQYPGSGLSRAQLWRWSRNGQIQTVTLPSGRKRFPREEIERLLTPKVASSPSDAADELIGQEVLPW